MKRLRRGKDFHAWAYYCDEDDMKGFCHFAEPYRPKHKPTPKGRWVQVKFVEARPRKRK